VNPWGLIFIAVGVFTIVAVALNWDWFLDHGKARWISSIAGRWGARIAYGAIGLIFVAFGVLYMVGIIKDTR